MQACPHTNSVFIPLQNAELHIIIFDEIDAICKQRGSNKGGVYFSPLLPSNFVTRTNLALYSIQKTKKITCFFFFCTTYTHYSHDLDVFRDSAGTMIGTGVHDTIVNQLLTKIDGPHLSFLFLLLFI
jgi:SpoVK/Ycf46/Vps4 family AAA+-type ATPase